MFTLEESCPATPSVVIPVTCWRVCSLVRRRRGKVRRLRCKPRSFWPPASRRSLTEAPLLLLSGLPLSLAPSSDLCARSNPVDLDGDRGRMTEDRSEEIKGGWGREVTNCEKHESDKARMYHVTT